VIEDTQGNIFGGFTSVEWESQQWNGLKGYTINPWKADPSLTSFLFTLKNPHNIPARRFTLKSEKKDQAIRCVSVIGPHFHDIGVSDNCNANDKSFTYSVMSGSSYINDPRLDGRGLFTGSKNFVVKEIEVFQITR
jgi:hypothetical protein